MHTKLTLSADPEVVALAKELAKEQGVSVSAFFAHIVRTSAAKRIPSQRPTPPGLRRLRGIISLSKRDQRKSYRSLVEEAIREKHGP
jgi:hypothetical protein